MSGCWSATLLISVGSFTISINCHFPSPTGGSCLIAFQSPIQTALLLNISSATVSFSPYTLSAVPLKRAFNDFPIIGYGFVCADRTLTSLPLYEDGTPAYSRKVGVRSVT